MKTTFERTLFVILLLFFINIIGCAKDAVINVRYMTTRER
jgi:hypothetical protein